MLHKLNILAITHKTADLAKVGKFYVNEADLAERLGSLKQALGLEEIMYLGTCNRVEFVFVTEATVDKAYILNFYSAFNPSWTDSEVIEAEQLSLPTNGADAVRHMLNVASSLDSLVVGEREIITQVRKSFEQCRELGLTGDLIRILMRQTIETAKEIYTQTEIAAKPVSVVSLAYRELRDLNVSLDARVLIVGAGVTNQNMSKYLKKHGFKNFTVFNRTLSKAQELASELKGEALPLAELKNYTKGFDVLVTCTGATEPIITKEVYSTLVGGDTKSFKVVVDLAIPNDFDLAIKKEYAVELIEVKSLEAIAARNLKEREKEVDACLAIIENRLEEFKNVVRLRQVELAMNAVPSKIKEIRENIFNEVFNKEINQLDDSSRELLEKVVAYMEKKCISVPMKLAKEILIEEKV